MENVTPKYKRVLLKLSGEALAKDADGMLNFEYIEQIAEVLKKCVADFEKEHGEIKVNN